MIIMTLNTDAVSKALIQYLQTDLNMNVSNKTIDVSIVVGRKSADKPNPDITATINIQDSVAKTIPSSKPAVTEEFKELDPSLATSPSEMMEDDEEDVFMPAETPESFSTEDEEEVDQPVTTSSSIFGNNGG